MSHRPMTAIEKQQAYLRKIGDVAMPCPNCFQPVNWWDVLRIPREQYDGMKSSIEGPCPHCGAILKDTVPFMGPAYLWAKQEDVGRPPLLEGKRYVFYIDETQKPDPEKGYIPSVVVEGEPGHRPMTGDPAKMQTPWYWGDLATAQKLAAERNARMGYDEKEMAKFILSSMMASRP